MRYTNKFLMYYPLAWLDLIESIIWIITFAQWKPTLSLRWICWYSIKHLEKATNKWMKEKE